MEKFTKLTGKAVPFDSINVDTDQIIPAPFLSIMRTDGYDGLLFHRVRRDEDGELNPDFIFNKEIYADASIIVADRNFGCGSSREGAAWALVDNGFFSVIAPSFGDIHFNNEMNNGMVPVRLDEAVCADLRAQLHADPGAEITVDLETNTVTAPNGDTHSFSIPEFNRERLLKGLDEIELTLNYEAQIERFEAQRGQTLPYIDD
ncbi:MAG: 3-isopropylmalate dehydratase small subunit [Rhodospirillaceae bacterium]|nr:3-isopropylmalate dehydratase small subunit [Rhodospirillaceae bacterium]